MNDKHSETKSSKTRPGKSLEYQATSPTAPIKASSDHLFKLDPDTQTLIARSKHYYLRNKLWKLLNILLNYQGTLVSRELLIQRVWMGNQYTGEKGLTHAMCHLRRIVKQSQLPVEINTIPKQGYILSPSVPNLNQTVSYPIIQSFSPQYIVSERQNQLTQSYQRLIIRS